MQNKEAIVKLAIEIALKVGLIASIFYISLLIAKPFIGLIAWAVILAVALFPVIEKISKTIHTSRKTTVIIFTALVVLALALPTYTLSDKAIDSITHLSHLTRKKELTVPAAPKKLHEIPYIGEKLYDTWEQAAHNPESLLKKFTPQIKRAASKAIAVFKSTLLVVFLSMAAFIIAAFFIVKAETYKAFYIRMMQRFLGEKASSWADLTILTIRSVANGIIGVAVVQASLALLGLIIYGVPFSILIALAIMFLTIIQLPAIIAIGPVLALVLSQDTSTGAIVFSVYMLIVGAIDGVLKPILMGRGVDIPMLVVLVGAIGGMLLMGMIGLFIGAVVFALAYKLFILWLEDNTQKTE